MTIHFLPDPRPASLLDGAINRLQGVARCVLTEMQSRRAGRATVAAEQAAQRARLDERRRIFFTSLGTTIRTATGNHGRPKRSY